ncbi:LysE family translocator [Streptomyces sp. NPDC060035]|uniref:LysE family translocator n=1 Tax=Streptomyces sp. NPDC060035 TaxID=3347044 RepID=UPI00369A7795
MDTTTLAAFLAVDLLLVLTPGADWAYAIAAGLRERSVVPAVAGLIAGYGGYTLLAVAGLVMIVASSASLLTALTVLGAAYLVWLGWNVLKQPAGLSASTETGLLPPESSAEGCGDQRPQPQGAAAVLLAVPAVHRPRSGLVRRRPGRPVRHSPHGALRRRQRMGV